MNMEEPTNCNRCQASLERGCSQTFTLDGELKETICHDCARRERLAEWQATSTITTRLMSDAAMPRSILKPVYDAVNRIQERVKLFDLQVWRSGLSQHLAQHKERGESLEYNGLKILTFVMAGRVMITLEDDRSSLTLITAEDDPQSRMGIQGIDAREHQAHDLLERAMHAWRIGLRPQPDQEVRVLGM